MPIVERDGTWWIAGQRFCYALRRDEEGQLRHLHFGSLLTDADVLGRAAKFTGPFMGNLGLEYPAWGGLYFEEPCLKLSFADGSRGALLEYSSHRIWEEEGVSWLEITLRDPAYPLLVRLAYGLHEGYDLLERYAEVVNESGEPVQLEEVLSAAWHLPPGGGYTLVHLAGRWGAETQVIEEPVTPGKKVLESRRGHTSHFANPWYAITRGKPLEESCEVWFGAVAWSGNWKLAVEADTTGRVQVSGGINDFDFAWRLGPGESFRTPSFFGGFTSGGLGDASRVLHRFERERVLPREFASQPRPVLYNSWEATGFDINEENQSRLAEIAASLGVELFVVDDGWFGARDSDRAGLGDWTPSPKKFPQGLGPLIQRVKDLGMAFGLWVEPEMVNPDSDLYRAHPDWVYHFPKRPRTESRNQLVLNLARPEVEEHITSVLDKLLSEYDIDFIKWDMNRPFSEPGWPDAPPERQREVWVRHVQAVYRILRTLRERHPRVAFESCSGGGGRVDLGIMALTDQVWTSDNTDAYDRLWIQEGYSMAYCARTMMCWVTDSPSHFSNRAVPLRFRFHCAMMGGLGIGGNLLKWSEPELEEARRLVARYKEIRHIVQFGDQYRLSSPRKGDVTAVQYVSPERGESVCFVLRPVHRLMDPMPRVRLLGLDPDATYQVEPLGVKLRGDVLMAHGLELPLWGDWASELLWLRRG
ncbi:glycoside hydrolase clan GH-D [Thermobaculum terrenum ATCC BAA-798]|uniref:Alpha-galactosidase n=1 Tax=Thermobaculum terrenum (strain ATCC BAA-798 / CCMEE 7001 / YNP1) TaxID=525904 RepID=D1CHW2_THET1|nr:alpha-galactosidase [Thermobaculum terrenum]ACZ43333.1 glycoside hydrolase clan GH-D [Thermobaculum terrenum ATCC BAA-798]